MDSQPKRPNRLPAPPSAPPENSPEFFTCSYPDCSYKSNWEENVGRHEWGHNPAGLDCNIPCQVCPQKFLYPVSFLHHMTSKHSDKLFCPWCLFLGEDWDEFKAHMLAHFAKPKPPKSSRIKIPKTKVKDAFNCAACSKNFAYQRTLHRHQKHYCTSNCTPAQRPKSTSNTGRKIGRPKTLTNIELRCANCSLTFLKKANLVRHQRNICRIALLRCDQCSYRTSFAEDLRKHINIHLAGEQLKCKHFGCDYSTLWTQHLRKHQQSCKIRAPAPETFGGISRAIDMLMEEMKIVEGESEYSCSFCSFKSKLMSRLREHLKVHVGRKPLRCPRKGCKYETKWAQTLRSHMRRVHPRKAPKAPFQTEENLGLNMEYQIKTEFTVEIQNESQDPLENFTPESCPNQVQIPAEISDQVAIDKIKTEETTEALVKELEAIDEETRPNKITKNPPKVIRVIQPRKLNRLSIPPSAPPKKSQEYFSCSYPDCSYKSNWEENVGRHERGHNPTGLNCNIPCQVCSQKFLYLVSFLHHMTSKHSDKLFCPWCLFLGQDLDEFKPHILAHFNLQNSKPEEPELTLDNNDCKSNNPVTVQNEKVLKDQGTQLHCDKCSFTTSSANNLRHHSWKHTSMKPFKCPNLGCTFATRWSSSLGKHRRSCPIRIPIPAETSDQPAVEKIKTEDRTEALVEDVKAIDGETLFCCTICSFRSKWKPSLRVHLRVHDDTRPFHCVKKGCKYQTKWSSELRKHYRTIHQLELPSKPPLEPEENLGSDREGKDKLEGFVSSSTIAFACMFCEFIGDSKSSALEHSCKHKTVVVSLSPIVPNAETILGL